MKLRLIIFAIVLGTNLLIAQNWKRIDAPLMTPWAEKVDVSCPLPEYPRPQMVRNKWKNLNGLWEFQEANTTDKVPLNRALTSTILVPYPWQSALSGQRINIQRAWYRNEITIPADWKNQNIILHFGAVDYQAEVYVNGRCAGIHKGGYSPFSFDITQLLANKNKQEIIVGVYDPGNDKAIATGKQSNNKFDDPSRYSYCPSSGIWQTVWIEPVPDQHITHHHLVPDIDQENIQLTVDLAQINSNASIRASIKEGEKLISEAIGVPSIPFTINNPSPKLWSPSSPFLYDLEIEVIKDGEVIDKIESYFGMRKISLALNTQGLQKIMLNNKFIFQMGPLDQGYWPDGIYTPPTDEAIQWEIQQMKEWGFNMNRHHIKIESDRWYYWCDKMGLLVWQDMPGTWKKRTEQEKTQFEHELMDMVKTLWNHPSIVNWIVFNEHWGLYDCERITKNIMELDPSRLVTGNSGIDAGKPNIDYEVGHIIDNHSYRPPNVPFATQKRASVCGEYGAIGYLFENHVWDQDGPWVHYNYKGIDEATAEYQKFANQLIEFKKDGLCAAVYTQWTDVENEMNGLYTYDRKKIKLHKDSIRNANIATYKSELINFTEQSETINLLK